MSEQIMSRASKRKEKKKGKKIGWIITSVILVVLLVIGLFQIPNLLSVFSSFNNVALETASDKPETMGLLILGIDNDGGGTVDTGHTDSITYIGADFNAKKAYALPIYRDANIPVSCAVGTTENINRIYSQKGIECLAQSTSDFLNLPIDNYAILTIDGFIKIVSELGELEMKPTETFCSKYGADKSVEYCFTKGEAKMMKADEVVAYLRYRGGGNGENRANRQVQLLQAIKNRCVEDMLMCYQKAVPHFGSAFKTNIAMTDVNKLSNIFGSSFELDTLEVIQGVNEQTATGWTQFVDEEDKRAKTEIIRSEIFSG